MVSQSKSIKLSIGFTNATFMKVFFLVKFCGSDTVFMCFMNVPNKPLITVTPQEKAQCVSWFIEAKLDDQTKQKY